MALSGRLIDYILPLAIICFLFGVPNLDYSRAFAFLSTSSGNDTLAHEVKAAAGRTVKIDSANFIDHTDSAVHCPASDPSVKIHLYSRQPLVIYVESLVSAGEIEQLVDLTSANLRPSLVGSGNDTLGTNQQIRNSTTAAVPVDHQLSVCIARRAQDLQGWPQGLWLEKLMVQRYIAPYGHYSHHFDWAAARGGRGRMQSGGRQSSFMVWLNTPSRGGGTNFPRVPARATDEWCSFIECGASKHAGTTFKAIKGNAVFWENFNLDTGALVEESWHAGLPVEEGEKWGMNVWSWWLPRLDFG